MLARAAANLPLSRSCRFYTTGRGLNQVTILPDAELATFRESAFEPCIPALLPRRTFAYLPAIERWFSDASTSDPQMNLSYLGPHGGTPVPLELSTETHFSRSEYPLSLFLTAANTLPISSEEAKIYLAQCPLPYRSRCWSRVYRLFRLGGLGRELGGLLAGA